MYCDVGAENCDKTTNNNKKQATRTTNVTTEER